MTYLGVNTGSLLRHRRDKRGRDQNLLLFLRPQLSILSLQAMFLSKLAESKQSVVALKGIEKDMMALLLDYAYSSSLTITRSNVQCLLSAANLLQVWSAYTKYIIVIKFIKFRS